MISYLRGKARFAKWGFLILDVNGVGYKIFVPINLNIPPDSVGREEIIEFFVHQHLREDTNDLYGFLSFQELEIFEKLISVNGVGPKVGLTIMSSADPKKIYQAIESDDLTFFCAVPGIGKKVAAKIILDLKSKISSVAEMISDNSSDDLFEALASLGYSKSNVLKIIPKIPGEICEVDEKIRWILKNLSK